MEDIDWFSTYHLHICQSIKKKKTHRSDRESYGRNYCVSSKLSSHHLHFSHNVLLLFVLTTSYTYYMLSMLLENYSKVVIYIYIYTYLYIQY